MTQTVRAVVAWRKRGWLATVSTIKRKVVTHEVEEGNNARRLSAVIAHTVCHPLQKAGAVAVVAVEATVNLLVAPIASFLAVDYHEGHEGQQKLPHRDQVGAERADSEPLQIRVLRVRCVVVASLGCLFVCLLVGLLVG